MTPQTYETHVHRPTAWSITWLICLAAALLSVWAAWRDRTSASYVLVLSAFATFGIVNLLRVFALRLQDRIIRLEMDARLRRLGLERELAQLDLRQLVALRFASDTEMGALSRRAVTEKLTADQIKRAVTDWQGDYLRT